MFVNNCLVMIAVTFVRFCRQDEVMPSRSKTVAVTVEVCKELLQDMMLVVIILNDTFRRCNVEACCILFRITKQDVVSRCIATYMCNRNGGTRLY